MYMKKLLAMATMVAVALGFAGTPYCMAADTMGQPKSNVAQKNTEEKKTGKSLKDKKAAKKDKKGKKGRKAKKGSTKDTAPKGKKTEATPVEK
jgi:hypothetical protein